MHRAHTVAMQHPEDKKKRLRERDWLTRPPRLEGKVKKAMMNPVRKPKKRMTPWRSTIRNRFWARLAHTTGYGSFPQVTDEDVRALLWSNAREG